MTEMLRNFYLLLKSSSDNAYWFFMAVVKLTRFFFVYKILQSYHLNLTCKSEKKGDKVPIYSGNYMTELLFHTSLSVI